MLKIVGKKWCDVGKKQVGPNMKSWGKYFSFTYNCYVLYWN